MGPRPRDFGLPGRAARASLLALLVALASPGHADSLSRLSLQVGGQAREALLALPKAGGGLPHPVIFAFHGHGGTMETAQKKFRCEALWPEALVVYPQGLPTPGGIVDPEGRLPGWQLNQGEEGDRDLAFFDALMAQLRSAYAVDEGRVYVVGHSNGAVFAYLLWAARGPSLTAIAAIAGILPTRTDRSALRPLPVFHAAGRNDPIVKFAWQAETMDFVKALNRCVEPAEAQEGSLRIYRSAAGMPLATSIDDGGHEMPRGIMGRVVAFFKGIRKG